MTNGFKLRLIVGDEERAIGVNAAGQNALLDLAGVFDPLAGDELDAHLLEAADAGRLSAVLASIADELHPGLGLDEFEAAFNAAVTDGLDTTSFAYAWPLPCAEPVHRSPWMGRRPRAKACVERDIDALNARVTGRRTGSGGRSGKRLAKDASLRPPAAPVPQGRPPVVTA